MPGAVRRRRDAGASEVIGVDGAGMGAAACADAEVSLVCMWFSVMFVLYHHQRILVAWTGFLAVLGAKCNRSDCQYSKEI